MKSDQSMFTSHSKVTLVDLFMQRIIIKSSTGKHNVSFNVSRFPSAGIFKNFKEVFKKRMLLLVTGHFKKKSANNFILEADGFYQHYFLKLDSILFVLSFLIQLFLKYV